MEYELQKEFKELLFEKGCCYKELMVILQMARSTFYRKLNSNGWTINEFNIISNRLELTCSDAKKYFGLVLTANVQSIRPDEYIK